VKVFISYRREDSAGYTGRLYDSLRAHFGDDNVFLDVSGIDSGRKFADVIQGAIHSCHVLLAVIGPEWLTCAADGRRRIDDPGDLVRTEILTALNGAIRVIPVLVGGAAPPAVTTLPPALQPLAALDAHDMTDERWAYDTGRLIQAMETLAGRRRRPAALARPAIVAGAVLLLALLTGGVLVWQGRGESSAASGANAAAAGAVQASTVAGEWQADVTYDWGAKYTERLSLRLDGREVSGTASFLGVPRGITTGTLDGDRITFETRTEEALGDFSQPRAVVHRYRGRITGDAIAFTMQTEGGSSQVPTEFTATRR
jgi:TIR domain